MIETLIIDTLDLMNLTNKVVSSSPFAFLNTLDQLNNLRALFWNTSSLTIRQATENRRIWLFWTSGVRGK